MNTKTVSSAALILLAATFGLWCAGRAGAQKGPGGAGRLPVTNETPKPARTPRRPRPGKGAAVVRRSTPRFVYVTVVSTLPNGSRLPDCGVAVDDELEEKGTDEQGRLVIPMEPGVYNIRVTRPGYVTDGREVEVKASPAYRQEELFTLTRELLSLKVKTNPAGIKVTLDGSREGESDAEGWLTFKQVDLSVRHTLRGFKENFVGEPVTVLPYQKEATVRLTRDLLTLKVKTYPPQAMVYLDDVLKGTSDADGVLLIPKVKTGKEHSLRAEKDGVTHSVTVPPDYELAVVKLPSASGEAQGAQVEPARRPETGTGGGASPPRDDAAREGGARQGDGATPAPPSVETPTPTPTTPQRSAETVPSLEVELKFWDSIKDSKNPEEFAAYLRKYPQGQFAELALIRMNDLLAKKKAAPEPAATPPPPESAKPTPTPAPAVMSMTAPPPAATPTPAAASALAPATEQPKPSQRQPVAANVRTAATAAEAPGSPALEETMSWLSKNFGSKFTYRFTEPRQITGSIPFPREASVDFEPLRFENCGLEWRVFDDVHKVSLSDLDPLGVKVEPRRPPARTSYSVEIWSLVLNGAGDQEVFVKMEGGRGAAAKRYRRMVLLYDDKEKAGRVAAALTRAIALCGGKARP